MNKINQMDLTEKELPDVIIIYGAGNIGKSFYQKICNRCEVLFFLDKKPKESSYGGVPIIQDKKVIREYINIPVIVTACYEYEKIRESLLLELGGAGNICSLEDFLL